MFEHREDSTAAPCEAGEALPSFYLRKQIMDWFKHSTGSHDDPDISDAWDELGEFGYVGFFVILELYGQEYSHRDSEDFITISKTFLKRKLRKSWTKVELFLNFYQERQRILFKIDGDFVSIKVQKFLDIADNWTKRPQKVNTEKLQSNYRAATAIEEEEKKKEKKNINILSGIGMVLYLTMLGFV